MIFKHFMISFLFASCTISGAQAQTGTTYLSQNLQGQNQNNAPKLTVQDIEKQIEIRLNKVWSSLPQIPTGKATYQFSIQKDGSLNNLFAVESSKNPDFDKAAMGTVKRVIPLPNLPEHLEIVSLQLRASFLSGQTRAVTLDFAPLSFDPPKSASPPQAAKSPVPKVPQIEQISKASPYPKGNSTKNVEQSTSLLSAEKKAQALYKLTNLGVVAMTGGDNKLAIEKLEEALKIDKNHRAAKQNLAIAYNNYGLSLRKQPEAALKIYHRAIALDPDNSQTASNLEAIITMLGKDPGSFKDRLALGDQALKAGDKEGARVEYLASLKLRDDPALRARLAQLDNPGMPPVKMQSAKTTTGAKPPIHNTKGKTGSPQTSPPQKPTTTHAPIAKPVKPVAAKTKQPGTASANKLDMVYKHLESLEKRHFQKTFSQDDILTRLTRLETKVFGSAQNGSTSRRLDSLFLAN